MFLTPKQVEELTDIARSKGQIQWLSDHGIPFMVGKSGKPKVLTAEIERRRLGSRTKKKVSPRLDLVS